MKGTQQPKKVLVIEDEPAISDVCRRVLVEEGFEVDIATNGLVAQGKLLEKDYDLCLVDIRTPAMNGKELYHWLEKKLPQVMNQVIFTTGDMMGGDTERFLKQVGRPFLPKPFTPDELRVIIQETLLQIEK